MDMFEQIHPFIKQGFEFPKFLVESSGLAYSPAAVRRNYLWFSGLTLRGWAKTPSQVDISDYQIVTHAVYLVSA